MFKRHKVEILLGIIFTPVGLLITILGISSALGTYEFKKTARETAAVISSIEEYRHSDGEIGHNVFVRYTVDGTEYNEKLGYYHSNMHEGQQINVLYNPANPRLVKSESATNTAAVAALGGGLVFLFIGCALLGFVVIKEKDRKYLLTHGKAVDAEIEEVVINTKTYMNNKHPYNIICHYLHTDGKVYRLKSGDIWHDVKAVISARNIKTLPVYIDMDRFRYNPKKYYMELGEL